MKYRNVCKFSALPSAHALEIRCFVLETDQAVIARRVQLKWNRAYLFTRGEGTVQTAQGALAFRPGTLILGFEREWISIAADNPCGR